MVFISDSPFFLVTQKYYFCYGTYMIESLHPIAVNKTPIRAPRKII